jgi:hypothetical protein
MNKGTHHVFALIVNFFKHEWQPKILLLDRHWFIIPQSIEQIWFEKTKSLHI